MQRTPPYKGHYFKFLVMSSIERHYGDNLDWDEMTDLYKLRRNYIDIVQYLQE